MRRHRSRDVDLPVEMGRHRGRDVDLPVETGRGATAAATSHSRRRDFSTRVRAIRGRQVRVVPRVVRRGARFEGDRARRQAREEQGGKQKRSRRPQNESNSYRERGPLGDVRHPAPDVGRVRAREERRRPAPAEAAPEHLRRRRG